MAEGVSTRTNGHRYVLVWLCGGQSMHFFCFARLHILRLHSIFLLLFCFFLLFSASQLGERNENFHRVKRYSVCANWNSTFYSLNLFEFFLHRSRCQCFKITGRPTLYDSNDFSWFFFSSSVDGGDEVSALTALDGNWGKNRSRQKASTSIFEVRRWSASVPENSIN